MNFNFKTLGLAVLTGLTAITVSANTPQLQRATSNKPRAARVFHAPTVEKTSGERTRIIPTTLTKQHRSSFGQFQSVLTQPKAKAPVMRVLGDGTTIYGSMIFNDTWTGYGSYGLYSFPASSTPTPTLVQTFEGYDANGGGAYYNGKYYFNSFVYEESWGYTFNTFFTVDLATGEYTKITNGLLTDNFDQSQITIDMTADPTTGVIYASSYIEVAIDEEGLITRFRPAVSIVDPTMGWTTPIAQTPEFVAIACNQAGELYGITKGSESALYRINKSNADCTKIGPTGLNPEFVQSACFDPVTDKLYWAAVEYNGSTGLYEVDVKTGAASKIASYPNNEEYAGIFIPEPQVDGGAPAIATDLGTDFIKDALSGTLLFTAPTETQSGAALSGTFTAEVSLDGADFASIDVTPGQNVTVAVTNLSEGVHNFGVYFMNAAGEGLRVAKSFYAGMDAPAPVENLTLSANSDGQPVISWETPTTGRNDGYIDPAQIRYTVVRYPDNLTIATGLSTTNVTDRTSFDAQNVYYVVTPFIGTREGLPATTATELFGSGSALPVTFDFATKEDFNLCTVIDANNDVDVQYHWGAWFYGPDFPAASTEEGCAVYGYSPENAADDWIIMPPFQATAGRKYRVTFSWRTKSDEETLAVTAGYDKTVAAQTISVLPAKGYKNETVQTTSAEFTSTEEGNCFVGFHITSGKKKFYYYLFDVTIDEVPLTGAPAAPANFTVTPGEKGALTATLSLSAPNKTAEGATLTSLTSVEIYRGNEKTPIHTFNTPAAGATLTWTDTEPAHGFNTYRAVAFNSVGQGEKAVAEAFIGVDVPLAVTDAVLVEENGVPVIKWTAPAGGVNGGFIDTEALTYVIRRNDGSLMSNKATGTSYTDRSLNPVESQYLIYYQIQPVSSAGVGDYALTNELVYGDPYEGDFYESFADRYTENDPWTAYLIKGSAQRWTILSAGTSPYCMPVDGDGGLAVFQSTYGRVGDEGRLVSPKLNLASFQIPVLTFYVYNNPSYDAIYGADPYLDRLIPEVRLPDGSYVAIDDPIYVDDPEWTAGWLGYEYDLSAYKSYDYIQLSFHGIADYENDICLDGISLTSQVEYDLAMYSFSAPTSVKAGKDINFNITVANFGINPASDFKINILRNGEQFTTVTSSKAVPEKSYASYKLAIPTTNEEEGKSYTWQAVIEWANDKLQNNNASPKITTKIVAPDVPQVRDFTATRVDGKTLLAWNGPSDALHVNDGFESYTSYAIDNIGDYKVIDGDGNPTYTFQGFYYDNSGEPMAFMVFNPDKLGISPTLPEWGAHTGSQTLAAFGCYTLDSDGYAVGAKADDWLISPELIGGGTIEFYAKTPEPFWGFEKFEVLYSTTNDDPKSFTALSNGTLSAPADWTLFTFELPANTVYFAIHYVTEDGYVMYIDDLKYVQKLSQEGFELTGYRLYRNGTILGDYDTATLASTDSSDLADGLYTYGLSSLYANGKESAPVTATVQIGQSGIDNPEAADVRVTVNDRVITVYAPGSMKTVTDLSGRVLAAEDKDCDELSVAVNASGVYLVTVNKRSYKLFIK